MELPGAKAEVYVQSQCEDGQLCEDPISSHSSDSSSVNLGNKMQMHFYFASIVDEEIFTYLSLQNWFSGLNCAL